MKFFYLFNSTSSGYVAVDARMSDQVDVLGDPVFDGHPVPEVIVWGMFKQYGGVVFTTDGWRPWPPLQLLFAAA